jgi:hypothetical protein
MAAKPKVEFLNGNRPISMAQYIQVHISEMTEDIDLKLGGRGHSGRGYPQAGRDDVIKSGRGLMTSSISKWERLYLRNG